MSDKYEDLFPELEEEQRSHPAKRAIRRDLKEEAFRKYEPFIAKACMGSFMVDPSTLGPQDGFKKPVGGATFKARFSDALLAYRQFGYASGMIPPDYNTRWIKSTLMEDGRVLLENEMPYGQHRSLDGIPANRLTLSNKDLARSTAKDIHDRKQKGEKITPIYFSYTSIDELTWAESLENEFYNLIVSTNKTQPTIPPNLVMFWA